jgi:hypothetical protein
MTTCRFVPRSEWPDLFARFTRQYRAALGSVHDVAASEPEIVAQGVALQSMRLEKEPSGEVVRLSFLDGPYLRVKHPQTIRIEETERGAVQAVEIDSAPTGLLRLAFRATPLPEELDGMAPSELRALAAAEREAPERSSAA